MIKTKESGFSAFGIIITVALLIILIGAGYFTYSLIKDKKENLTKERLKNIITDQLDKTKDDINTAADKAVKDAVNDAKDTAVENIKGAVNDTLNKTLGN